MRLAVAVLHCTKTRDVSGRKLISFGFACLPKGGVDSRAAERIMTVFHPHGLLEADGHARWQTLPSVVLNIQPQDSLHHRPPVLSHPTWDEESSPWANFPRPDTTTASPNSASSKTTHCKRNSLAAQFRAEFSCQSFSVVTRKTISSSRTWVGDEWRE